MVRHHPEEGLTVNQTAERFGVSYRTIYRILHRHGVEHGQMEEPDQAGGPMTGAAMYRMGRVQKPSHQGQGHGQQSNPGLSYPIAEASAIFPRPGARTAP